MGIVSSVEEELPDWLKFPEFWLVEIVHWNSDAVRVQLSFRWGAGQNDVSMGRVLNEMKKQLGESIPKKACVVLISKDPEQILKLDSTGCYRKTRKFLHECIHDRPGSKNLKVTLQYSLEEAVVADT